MIEEHEDQYDALPISIRVLYTREEYLWLSDAEKANLIRMETEPDEARG